MNWQTHTLTHVFLFFFFVFLADVPCSLSLTPVGTTDVAIRFPFLYFFQPFVTFYFLFFTTSVWTLHRIIIIIFQCYRLHSEVRIVLIAQRNVFSSKRLNSGSILWQLETFQITFSKGSSGLILTLCVNVAQSNVWRSTLHHLHIRPPCSATAVLITGIGTRFFFNTFMGYGDVSMKGCKSRTS